MKDRAAEQQAALLAMGHSLDAELETPDSPAAPAKGKRMTDSKQHRKLQRSADTTHAPVLRTATDTPTTPTRGMTPNAPLPSNPSGLPSNLRDTFGTGSLGPRDSPKKASFKDATGLSVTHEPPTTMLAAREPTPGSTPTRGTPGSVRATRPESAGLHISSSTVGEHSSGHTTPLHSPPGRQSSRKHDSAHHDHSPPSLDDRAMMAADQHRTKMLEAELADTKVVLSNVNGSFAHLRDEYQLLQKEMEGRQASYMRRYNHYKAKVEELKREIVRLKSEKIPKEKMTTHQQRSEEIRNTRDLIHESINRMNETTADSLMAQQAELEAKHKKILRKRDRALISQKNYFLNQMTEMEEMDEQTKKIMNEYSYITQRGAELDKQITALQTQSEKQRLRIEEYKEKEEIMLQRISLLRRDNDRLRLQVDRGGLTSAPTFQNVGIEFDGDTAHNSSLPIALPSKGGGGGAAAGGGGTPRSGLGSSRPGSAGSRRGLISSAQRPRDIASRHSSTGEFPPPAAETKSLQTFKDTIGTLRKKLGSEISKHKKTKAGHSRDMASRTELEDFLRDAVEQVKTEVAEAQAQQEKEQKKAAMGVGPKNVAISDLQAKDRQRVIDLLLSKERVLTLLYAKTFPPKTMAAEPLLQGVVGDLKDSANDKRLIGWGDADDLTGEALDSRAATLQEPAFVFKKT
eukprot:gnl/Hemi2/2294_TR820_c0_g1_i1.p1 gnl/Hemi2/2294_TR820_c0_g1~~gnl/Hemi2/2294_TR820_c0_g1_i1.p1  ORF type:complete len:778 (+),score=156.52 gnl/Hemi2/2294_TR820_c0_g1_i1:278-2335(+)